LDGAFDVGKEIDGANSVANAVRIGDGSTPMCFYTDASLGPMVRPCTDANVNTIIATLGEANVLTVDKFGSRATIVAGELASLFGIPLIASEQMKLADTDGKVTSAGNVADTGRVLAFNTTQWRVGFRRGITVEPDRDPGKGQTVLYVSMRIALVPRGTRASATHTSLIYDITTVT